MRGQAAPRDLLAETDYREYTFKPALIAPDGWKLIHTLESNTSELYNLNSDPHERVNCVESQPVLVEKLKQRLFTAFRSIGHDLSGRSAAIPFINRRQSKSLLM